MRRARHGLLSLVLLALSCGALACLRNEMQEDAEVLVTIDADAELAPQLAKIAVEVRDESGRKVASMHEFALGGGIELPISFGVYQPPGGADWFLLQVSGLNAEGELLVEHKRIAHFKADGMGPLEVTLSGLCSGNFCAGRADQTCNTDTGQCESLGRPNPAQDATLDETDGRVREQSDAGDAGGANRDDATVTSTGDASMSGGPDAGPKADASAEAGVSTPALDAGSKDSTVSNPSDGSSAAETSVADANSADSGGAAWGQTLPATNNYSGMGPFRTTSTANTGPGGAYTIFRPETLGEHGFVHSPIVFGPGILTAPSDYTTLLTQLASHGFVTICVNTLSGGPGSSDNLAAMQTGLDWLIAQNSQAGVFQGKLAVNRAIAMGYSVGATASVQLSSHAAVITTVAIHCHNTSADPHGPVLLMTGTDDIMADVAMTLATLSEAPAIMVALPIGHLDALNELSTGGRYIAPITAWLRYWVNGDQAAKRYFWGASCDMCSSPWSTPQSNARWQAQTL